MHSYLDLEDLLTGPGTKCPTNNITPLNLDLENNLLRIFSFLNSFANKLFVFHYEIPPHLDLEESEN